MAPSGRRCTDDAEQRSAPRGLPTMTRRNTLGRWAGLLSGLLAMAACTSESPGGGGSGSGAGGTDAAGGDVGAGGNAPAGGAGSGAEIGRAAWRERVWGGGRGG